MDVKLWLEIIALAVVFGTSLFSIHRSIQSQFTKIKDELNANHHVIDVRLTKIESTVSPYAQNISVLQEQQRENTIKIAELMALHDAVARLDRQIEALQKR